MDIEGAHRHGYHFGAKLVRGAYMESERAYAKSMGYASPIHDTLQDTHDCYNDSVDFLLRQIILSTTTKDDDDRNKKKKKIEIMLASHNQESIENCMDSPTDWKTISLF
jgi:proline dehydrogenase